MRTAKTLVRLGECPGWSESLLGEQVILLVLSCCGYCTFNVCDLQIENFEGNCSASTLTFFPLPTSHYFLHHISCKFKNAIWAASWQNQQNDCVHSQDSDQPGHPPSLISECLLCTQWVAKDPSFRHADSEDSDQTGRMPRLICLRWAHMPFCWFCHELAHLLCMRSHMYVLELLIWQTDKEYDCPKNKIYFLN